MSEAPIRSARATLSLAGGNFSLGTDNDNNTFANPISVSGSGGTITAQHLGAGTTNSGQTIYLERRHRPQRQPQPCHQQLQYHINTNPIVGGSSLTYNSGGNTVNIDVANPLFTGTYNSNTGTTNDNVVGGLTTANVQINNGSTVNVNAQGETLDNGSVNNGTLALTQGNINIAERHDSGRRHAGHQFRSGRRQQWRRRCPDQCHQRPAST